jgi:DnaK suppressor protein
MDQVLTPTQLAELREELERELAQLERSLQMSQEAARPVALDQTAVGRLSRMDAIASQHMTKELQQRQESREGQILDALRRMASGSYDGRCTKCGAPIPFGRLLVMPEARTCAPCGGR